MSRLTTPAAEIASRGYARLPAADIRAWLGTDALAGWPAFAASWDELDTDDYMADGGRYRRRRHACFAVDDAVATRLPHRPHYQSRGYNALNGGIERWFTPVDPAIGAHPVLVGLIDRLSATFVEAAGVAAEVGAWLVEMHQFRIVADPRRAGLPTPEGRHRDGVDWVAVTLVGRTNVAGGVTAVTDEAGCDLGTFTLETPLDTVLLDDRRVWHGVTPVHPLDDGAPAHRDVLVLTFRDRRDR